MTSYISILRGINVSGHKIIKMEDLRKMYAVLGFSEVQTYIQSGNVIFRYKDSQTESLKKKIYKKINETFGFEVPVIVKEISEFKKTMNNNPFLKNKRIADTSKLHVTFLSEAPAKENSDKIKDRDFGSDEFLIRGDIIYLFIPEKYGNTKISNTFFENKLNVSATTRNWNTVDVLAKMAESQRSMDNG